MATVLTFPLQDSGLRKSRQAQGLSLTQAAGALGIAPATLDSWEHGNKAQIDAEVAAKAYSEYAADTEAVRNAGKNLLFGAFPMRVARDILELDIKEIAAEFGYAQSYWAKIEANARCARPEVIDELEQRIAARMSALCLGKQ